MVVDYATHLYNHIPNKQGIASVDLFLVLKFPNINYVIYMFGVVRYMFWILHFSKGRNYHAGNQGLAVEFLLVLVLIIQAMFLWF